MTQETVLMYFIGFIAAIFVLRMLRFTITLLFGMVEDTLRESFPKYDSTLRDFFLKIDFAVNKLRILGIRWHFIVAFLYIAYTATH
jgi:hypothetical protein